MKKADFSENALRRILDRAAFRGEFHFLPRVDSTNQVAKKLAREGAPHGTMVLAEEQTGGRGRWGRKWESPAGMGLWLSMILRGPFDMQQDIRLIRAAAGAVIRSVEKIAGVRLSFKWPNDLYYGGRKVAGMLIEGSQKRGVYPFLVLGIGLNVKSMPGGFPEGIRERAATLEEITGSEIDRAALFRELVLDLEKSLSVRQREPCFL
ncbi:biotin--[acetyl-CoA-carboxylase] ligase [bacterium]|nr:biotin--[acetyl-CoA-carboxylase] ligase [bacterium]